MKALQLTTLALALPALMLMNSETAHSADANYDESKVPQYTLPDPLTANDGSRVTTADQWTHKRRGEILKLFKDNVYGQLPAKPTGLKFTEDAPTENALDGKAARKQIAIHIPGEDGETVMHVLMYLPADSMSVPVFVAYNFYGNHTIANDSGILLSKEWMMSNDDKGVVNHRATEASRGTSSSRWDVNEILKRGYGLVTVYYGDIEPDRADGWKDGLRSRIHHDADGKPLPIENWSAISAWAWGLGRVMDYLATDPDVNAKQVVVMGHSRLGKTSLWAGATDPRFAIVISNDSGCGGAALSRRAFGETVKRINTSFPHWFCQTFKNYNDNEDACPVDQHELIALMAPRPVYVASAHEDQWADPKGEFLSAKLAGPVYALFGEKGVGVDEQPPVHTPVGDFIRYHIRAGKHDVTDYDWEQYLDFADRHFGRKH